MYSIGYARDIRGRPDVEGNIQIIQTRLRIFFDEHVLTSESLCPEAFGLIGREAPHMIDGWEAPEIMPDGFLEQ